MRNERIRRGRLQSGLKGLWGIVFCSVYGYTRYMNIHIYLTPEQLKWIDEIAETDRQQWGDEKPNRSKSIAYLIQEERKRRERRLKKAEERKKA